MRVPRIGRTATIAASALIPIVWWEARLGPPRPGGDIVIWGYDQYHYSVPALAYAARMLRQGEIPLWNPHQLCGAPFLATQLHGILYPIHWLAMLLPVSQALRLALIANSIVALLGAMWCARGFGASRGAALIAGIAFAFSGTLASLAIGWMEPPLVSAVWLPWQLGAVRRTLTARRHWRGAAIIAGVAFAMPLLGGHLPYVPVSASLSALYGLAHVACLVRRDGIARAMRRAARLGVVLLIACGLSAVQLLPTLDLARRSPPRPTAESVMSTSLLGPAEVLRSLAYPIPAGFGVSGEGRVGVLALALSAVAVLHRRSRLVRFLWIVAAGTGLLALGSYTPLYRLYLSLPGTGASRFPQRFLAATTLCLALLAALGADSVAAQARSRAPRAAAIGLGLLGGLLLAIWVIPDSGTFDDAEGARRLVLHAALFAAWCGAWLLAPERRWQRLLLCIGAAAVALELYGAAAVPYAIPATHPDALPVPAGAAAFIHARQGWARTFIANPPNESLLRPTREIPAKLGMLADLAAIGDYEPLFEARYGRLANHIGNGPLTRPGVAFQGPYVSSVTPEMLPLLRVLGVRFILTRRGMNVAAALAPAAYDDGAYQVFEVPDPLPRAYVARFVSLLPPTEKAIDEVARRTKFVLGGGALVEEPLGLPDGPPGTVEIIRYAPDSVELRAALIQPALVVLHDQYDPYWRATIDGTPARIVRTNGVFRGVVAAAGAHTIRFTYRPTPVYVGAAITVATLLALAGLGVVSARRRIRELPAAARSES